MIYTLKMAWSSALCKSDIWTYYVKPHFTHWKPNQIAVCT